MSINPVLFDNHLKVDLKLQNSLENARFGNQAAIGGAVSFDPTQPVYSKNPRYGGYFEWLDPTTATGLTNLAGRNPLGLLEEHFDKAKPKRSIGNLQLDYKFHFLPDLHANLNAGYDLSDGKGTTFIPDSAAESYLSGGTGGSNNKYRSTKTNTLFEFYLSYAKDLKSIKSHFDVLGGYSYNNYLTKIYNYATYYASGKMVPNSQPAFAFDKPEHTLISYFGRANYSFMDKYLLTGTLRYDGSSRFAPQNRWALFPSVAFAWKIKSESFLRDADGISDLKLRLGYGVTGQQDGIGNYDYLAYYSLSDSNAAYLFGNNYYQGYRPGGFYANRKWEQTATSNIGIDYGFLDNRITGAIDVYYKKTTNLLNNVPQPAGSNFSAYIVANVGDMNNKGIEYSINVQPIRTRDLTWDVGFNITYNKNKITNLTVVPNDTAYVGFPSGGIAGGIGGQFAEINAVGGSKNTFYLYHQVYDTKGPAGRRGLPGQERRRDHQPAGPLQKQTRRSPDLHGLYHQCQLPALERGLRPPLLPRKLCLQQQLEPDGQPQPDPRKHGPLQCISQLPDDALQRRQCPEPAQRLLHLQRLLPADGQRDGRLQLRRDQPLPRKPPRERGRSECLRHHQVQRPRSRDRRRHGQHTGHR